MVNIKDYNVGTEKLTEVEFVKVQDVNNYTCEKISSNPEITLTLSTNQVGATGGTVTYTITVSDGGAWYIENDGWNISSLSATSGTGDYEGTWTINPNSSSYEQNLTLTAFADNASVRATLTLRAYAVTLTRVDSGDIPASGGSATFKVVSQEAPWSAKTDYTGIITAITPSQGSATDSGGTTFTASFAPNEYTSSRYAWIYVELPNGQRAQSGYIYQTPAGNAGISVTPDYISAVPASGNQYTLTVYSTEPWNGYVTYADRISISPSSSQVSGYTNVTLTVNANTGDARYAQAYFYRDSSLNNPAILTIWQDAYVEPPTSAPLTLDIVSAGTVSYNGYASPMYYSTDNGATWNGGQNSFSVNANAGDKVMLKCTTSTLSGCTKAFSASTAYFNVRGNIMSVLYGDNFSGQTTLNGKASCFHNLFEKSNVVSAENLILPNAENGGNEFSYMFSECPLLVKTPNALPTGNYYTFSYMFRNCTALTDASNMQMPDTVSYGCYSGMFQGCSNLQKAPDLPATGGTGSCYDYMFAGCTSLSYIKCLLASNSGAGTSHWTESVSATGTFVKNSLNTGWTTGFNGIPSGWSVTDAQ